MMNGNVNLTGGLLFLGAFMAYGFVRIYLRDFAQGKEAWIADYGIGTHFEARLAHVHGNLFAFLNIVIGYLIMHLPIHNAAARWVPRLALAGMFMPLGILAEVLFGAPPIFVLLGAISMVLAVGTLGVAVARSQSVPPQTP